MSAHHEIDEAPTDPFEIGRREGAESGTQEPLTETQLRKVRTVLRQAEPETSPAKAS